MKHYNDFQEWLVAYLKYLLKLEQDFVSVFYCRNCVHLFDPTCLIKDEPKLKDTITNRAKLYILMNNYAHDVQEITNNGDLTKPMRWPKKAQMAHGWGESAERHGYDLVEVYMNDKGQYSGCPKDYQFTFFGYLKENLGWSTYTTQLDIKKSLGLA